MSYHFLCKSGIRPARTAISSFFGGTGGGLSQSVLADLCSLGCGWVGGWAGVNLGTGAQAIVHHSAGCVPAVIETWRTN